jgi:hypothetical protein
MSKQWVETVRWNLKDYDAFKRAFLNTWWSASRPNLVKCEFYQEKYNLEFQPIPVRLFPSARDHGVVSRTEALRCRGYRSHQVPFPDRGTKDRVDQSIENNKGNNRPIKRVEVMEASEGFERPHNQPNNIIIPTPQSQISKHERMKGGFTPRTK